MRVTSIGSLFLVFLLVSCASEGNGGNRSASGDTASALRPTISDGSFALVTLEADDSAAAATVPAVDAMMRQVFDSVGTGSWVSVAEAGLSGAESTELLSARAEKAGLDYLVALRIARFGSVVGGDFRVVAPDGSLIHHDRAFSFIRFREKDGTKLFGPALYELLQRLVHRMQGDIVGTMPDGRIVVADAHPLVIGSVIIPRDSALGRILDQREPISTEGVKALGDFLRFKYPEFIVFDYESRTRLYELFDLALVEDHEPVGDIERQAMYTVDIPYYLVAEIAPVGSDSIAIGVEVRGVTSVRTDSVVAVGGATYLRELFETSDMERDLISEILVISEEVVRRARASLSRGG